MSANSASRYSKSNYQIGIGYGKCGLLHVGGIFKRGEYLLVGEALKQALGCEGNCTEGGQIVVSRQCWDFIQNFFNGCAINPSYQQTNYLVKALSAPPVPSRADANLMRNLFESRILNNSQS